jgi:DNA-binding response OmpR family regulator
MPRGLVLVIEDDEWVSRLLQSAIREAGYDVIVCATAGLGLETAFEQKPDCIICDVDLPDSDGYSVARSVRTHASRVSVTPFLFLSGLDDEQSRLEGFHVGADVYMTKPFRVDEVVAQVDALVQMATRLRARRDSMLSMPPGAHATAIEGDLGQMSIATVLTVLEMERRTGTFEVSSKKRKAQIDIARGCVVDGAVGGTRVSALAALRTMLGWNVGRFSFTPSAHREPPSTSMKTSLGAFLIEAMRLADEETRAELELPPSRRRPQEPRLVAPALGGPASSPADFAPASSHTPEFMKQQAELAETLDPELADWEIPDEVAPVSEALRAALHPPKLGHRAIPPPPEVGAPPLPPLRKPMVPPPPASPAALKAGGQAAPNPAPGPPALPRIAPPRPPLKNPLPRPPDPAEKKR